MYFGPPKGKKAALERKKLRFATNYSHAKAPPKANPGQKKHDVEKNMSAGELAQRFRNRNNGTSYELDRMTGPGARKPERRFDALRRNKAAVSRKNQQEKLGPKPPNGPPPTKSVRRRGGAPTAPLSHTEKLKARRAVAAAGKEAADAEAAHAAAATEPVSGFFNPGPPNARATEDIEAENARLRAQIEALVRQSPQSMTAAAANTPGGTLEVVVPLGNPTPTVRAMAVAAGTNTGAAQDPSVRLPPIGANQYPHHYPPASQEDPQTAWRRELDAQRRADRERKALQKAREAEEDARYAAMHQSYNPWGRPGAGAAQTSPNKEGHGSVHSIDYGRSQHHISTNQELASSTQYSAVSASPTMNGGILSATEQSSQNYVTSTELERQSPSPIKSPFEERMSIAGQHKRGSLSFSGVQSLDSDRTTAALQQQNFLKQQIDHAEEVKRRKREENRLADIRDKLRVEREMAELAARHANEIAMAEALKLKKEEAARELTRKTEAARQTAIESREAKIRKHVAASAPDATPPQTSEGRKSPVETSVPPRMPHPPQGEPPVRGRSGASRLPRPTRGSSLTAPERTQRSPSPPLPAHIQPASMERNRQREDALVQIGKIKALLQSQSQLTAAALESTDELVRFRRRQGSVRS